MERQADADRGRPAGEADARGQRLSHLGVGWLVAAAAVSLLLLLATAANILSGFPGLLGFVLNKGDLSFENNPAATWSGMLLALAAAHAFDGHVRERLRSRDSARGWVLIALVLLVLSLDEIGSIHERLPWLPLFAFALVLGSLLASGLIFLHREQADWYNVLYLFTGFALMGSVVLHEVIEKTMEFQTAGAQALRAVLEEGSELLGMLIVLQVAMRNSAGFTARRTCGGIAFEAVQELRWPLVGFALVLAPILAHITSALPDQHRGHPADWATALLLLAAALAGCRVYFARGLGIGWHRWLFTGLCLLTLVCATGINPERVIELSPLSSNLRLLVVGTLALLAWAVWSRAPQVRNRWSQVAVGLMLAAVAGASLLPLGLFAVYGLSQVVGLVIYLVSINFAAGREADSMG